MTRLSDPTKRIKKTSFDFIKFLCQHHDANNIYDIKILANNPWHIVLRRSDLASKEGLLIFLDSKNTVLYIGQCQRIYDYSSSIYNYYGLTETARVIIVNNENPSKLVHAVGAYRAKFSPKYNSDKGTRFMFNSMYPTTNVNSLCNKAIDWITEHPDSKRVEFISAFNDDKLTLCSKLCRAFSLPSNSYKSLKIAVLSHANK